MLAELCFGSFIFLAMFSPGVAPSDSSCTLGTKITLVEPKGGLCPGIKQAFLSVDDSEGLHDGGEKHPFLAMQSPKEFSDLVKQISSMQNVLKSIETQFSEMKSQFGPEGNFEQKSADVPLQQNNQSVAEKEDVVTSPTDQNATDHDGDRQNLKIEPMVGENVPPPSRRHDFKTEKCNCQQQPPCYKENSGPSFIDDISSKISKHTVAWYTFDEDIEDSTGNGYHGNTNGEAVFDGDGVQGGALFLMGDSKINVDGFRLHPWGSGFSVSVWVKRTGDWDSEQVIISNGAPEYGTWDIRMGSQMAGQMIGANIFNCWDPYRRQWTYQDILAEHNVWHHVVVSFDGANFDFYLDGTKRQKTVRGACASDTPIRDTPLTIAAGGVGSSGHYFTGMIDELVILNTSLTYDDVKYLRGKSDPGECEDLYLVAYFPFDADFDDHSCYHRHGNKGDGQFVDPSDAISGSTANFDGRGRMEVELLNGYQWGSQFSVSIWYRRTDNFKKEQTLVWHGTWEIRTSGSSEVAAAVKCKDRNSEAGRLVLGQSSTYPYKGVRASDGEWHHVVLTYDGSLLRLYLDGIQQDGDEESCRGDIVIGEAPLMVGGRVVGVEQKSDVPTGLKKRRSTGGHDYFTGLIDELKLYRRVLYQNDIDVLYNGI